MIGIIILAVGAMLFGAALTAFLFTHSKRFNVSNSDNRVEDLG